MNELSNQYKGKIDQLEKEKTLLLDQVETLNRKLMESEAFKSHFISNVSNEIVNPFASISGLSKAIMDLKGKELEKAPEMAKLIFEESAFLDFQLTNIFAAARIESGVAVPELSKFEIKPLMDEVVEKFQYDLQKKKIKLQIESTAEKDIPRAEYIQTDREKLRLILFNLVSNAIKFSDPGKDVHLDYALREGQLSISIADEGKGMSEDEVRRIFDRFHRANPSIHSLNPGNGLGLAVVEGLLYVLEGDIKVDSSPGKGSRFQLIIPELQSGVLHEDEDGLFDVEEGETF
jgi:signal transduction histidine kinase